MKNKTKEFDKIKERLEFEVDYLKKQNQKITNSIV